MPELSEPPTSENVLFAAIKLIAINAACPRFVDSLFKIWAWIRKGAARYEGLQTVARSRSGSAHRG
jgi:hypothetical protein